MSSRLLLGYLLIILGCIGIVVAGGILVFAIAQGTFWNYTPIFAHNLPQGVVGWSLFSGIIAVLLGFWIRSSHDSGKQH